MKLVVEFYASCDVLNPRGVTTHSSSTWGIARNPLFDTNGKSLKEFEMVRGENPTLSNSQYYQQFNHESSLPMQTSSLMLSQADSVSPAYA